MKPLLSVFCVALLLVAFGTALGTVHTGPDKAFTGKSAAAPLNSALPLQPRSTDQRAANILNELRSRHVPVNYALLPNFNARVSITKGTVSPLYTSSPAPMGVGDFGLINTSSGIVGYNTTTSSIEGTIAFKGLQPFYLLNDAPQTVTVQLNAVLDNVTLFGVPAYSFWTQNVFFYSQRTHTLTFLDNIWNFSSPAFDFTQNSLYKHNGTIVAPVFYFDVGPTISVGYPFTVNLYLNSTVLQDRTAVFFNYSISSPTLHSTKSGSYDEVLFNSTSPGISTPTMPAPYLISGTTVTPTGYLLYDAELMIGGPGGGSTTSIYSINGTMRLQYLNSTTGVYNNVQSAFDFGTDTGETSEGVAVYWTQNAVAHLTAGPSLLYGMWNLSSGSPAGADIMISGTVSPSNAFLFVSGGSSFNNTSAAWAPVLPNGMFNFSLPQGVYSGAVLMSNYEPEYNLQMGPDMTVMLTANASEGVYTPLFAFNNMQLANLSSSGAGTVTTPYMITATVINPINQLFGELNDFFFPVFPGVMLVNTSSYAVLMGLPSFYIQYPVSQQFALEFFGFPIWNYMPFETYGASNVSIVGSPFISGWYPVFLYGFPLANLIVWNSSSVLIAGNYFSSMGSSALIFNSTDVLVWGNVFAENSLAGISVTHPTRYFEFELAPIYPATVPTGLSVFSSGDTIYNNAFIVDLPAISPDFNIYTFAGATYMDAWNVSFQLVKNAMPYTFNGIAIPPVSITGGSYLGGNFWYNYHPRSTLKLPFNDNGWIANGGDYVPLVLGSSQSSSYNSVLQPLDPGISA